MRHPALFTETGEDWYALGDLGWSVPAARSGWIRRVVMIGKRDE